MTRIVAWASVPAPPRHRASPSGLGGQAGQYRCSAAWPVRDVGLYSPLPPFGPSPDRSACRVGGGALNCLCANLRPPLSRVGDWRAGLGRSSCSLLARSFVCECHTISTMPRFQPPPRRTQRADFPHYAPPFASCQGLWDLSCWGDFRLCLIHRSQPRLFCS